MTVEFKKPEELDIEMLKEFATVVDMGIAIAGRPDLAHVGQKIVEKLIEAYGWVTHGIGNKPSVPVAPEITPEAPVEGVLVN